jgi:hypothetical protein
VNEKQRAFERVGLASGVISDERGDEMAEKLADQLGELVKVLERISSLVREGSLPVDERSEVVRKVTRGEG